MVAAFVCESRDGDVQTWLRDALRLIGIPQPDGEASEPDRPEWGGLRCTVTSAEAEGHRVLGLVFGQNAFLRLPDGGASLVTAFGAACEALGPRYGCVVTMPFTLDDDLGAYLRELAERVATLDNGGLITEAGVGLAYLPEGFATGYEQYLRGRDTVPLGSGRLVFSGEGSDRWG